MYDAVLRDRFGAELDQANPGSYVASQGWVFFSYSTGAMRQLRITWYIGNLPNGVTATLSFDVVTKLNPALKQEYTSAGLKILNSGAVLKWRDAAGVQHSMSTPPCYVMAGNTFGAVVGVVTDGSGNPVSGASVVLWNGAIFVGIDATDQHGFYYFPKVTPGDYQVQYSSTTENVTISGGEIETVNFGT